MRNNFVDKKFLKQENLVVFFYEVKIKESLLFDLSSWELIGFSDLDIDDKSSTVQKSLASHVLRAVAGTLYGGGGGMYSYIRVMPTNFF